ncbi:MAG: hypothetical protein WD467_02055 [Candidatus Saccharimonadales bacterium]
MSTLEDKKPDTKPDGSHDDVELSAAERAESDQLLASAEEGDSFYSDEGSEGKRGAGSRLAGAALKTTPVGRALSFITRNKKSTAVGGGILGFIVSVVALIVMIIPPTQLMWMNNVFQDFNFGPHDRSVVGRANRINEHLRLRRSNDTQLGQKIENVSADDAQRARVAETSGDRVSRYNRRAPFRDMIGSRIRGGFNWRFFTGHSRSSPSYVNSRNKMLGINDSSLRADARVEEINTTDEGETVRTEDTSRSNNINQITEEIKANPSESRTIARRAARRVSSSAVVATVMVGCLSAAYDDLIPDDQELYETLLTTAANFMTAGSQLAHGEEVHGDEIADTLSAYEDTIESDREFTAEGEGAIVEGEGTVHRSFSNSAAWKRATNQPTTGNEEDADLAYDEMVNIGLLSSTFRYIGGAVNTVPGTRAVCSFIGNPVVGFVATAGEGIAAFMSGGTTAAIKVALREGAFIASLAFLFEQVSFESIIPDGPEMLMATTDMGMNLSQSEFARSQGAPPVSSGIANALRADHYKQLGMEDRARGIAWRYFSLDNPRSTLTNIAMTHNFSWSTLTRSMASLPNRLSSLITNALFTSTAANEEFHNYNIQQYAFTYSDLDVDPLENAAYVESALHCGGGIDILASDNCTTDKTTEGELMLKIYDECIRTSRAYWQIKDSRLCTKPTSSERAAWVKVGVWNLDHSLVDSLECLSHDKPCTQNSSRSLNEEI